jgi:hypothetical protein
VITAEDENGIVTKVSGPALGPATRSIASDMSTTANSRPSAPAATSGADAPSTAPAHDEQRGERCEHGTSQHSRTGTAHGRLLRCEDRAPNAVG